jgi:hypothetical protein
LKSNTLRIWELDVPNRKIRPLDVMLGQTKRIIKSLSVSEVDDYFFCGTTTGDILQIAYPSGLFKAIGPEKNKFSMGITSIQCLKTGEILVGSGDGKVSLVTPGTFKTKKYETNLAENYLPKYLMFHCDVEKNVGLRRRNKHDCTKRRWTYGQLKALV